MPTEAYALCPMPYALCPVVPHLSEKGYTFIIFISPLLSIDYLGPSAFISLHRRLKRDIILPPPSTHQLNLLKRINFLQKLINRSQSLIPNNFNCVHNRLLAFRVNQ
jgi:hypothetical protein